jgi:hypothetical protein
MVRPRFVRQTGLSVSLWAFGFATTLLLIGLWGRSTSTDEGTIAESTRAVVTSELIRDRVGEWVEDELASTGLAGVSADDAVDRIFAIDEVRLTLDRLVAEAVAALIAGDDGASLIDVADALAPAAPLIAEEFGIEETVVRAAIATVDPIDLSSGPTAGISAAAASVHAALTLIVVLAALALAVFGGASVALAGDRRAMVGRLAARVALSGFSFALLFQFGGWLIDPNGGRSPVLTGGSILIRSNGHVFMAVAMAATLVAIAVTVRLHRSRIGDPASENTGEVPQLVEV